MKAPKNHNKKTNPSHKPSAPKAPVKSHKITRTYSRPITSPLSDFASLLKPLISKSTDTISRTNLQSAPLAHLQYSKELDIKNTALSLFWKKQSLQGRPEPVIASPMPRGYRTTSNRKAHLHGPTFHLLFGDKKSKPGKQSVLLQSPLEPKEHGQIYSFLQKKLSEPTYRLVATHLNYIIIRGSYTERAVIFNVNMMNGPLVRKLKMLAAHLQKMPDLVAAAFAYLDPSRSDYYLESRKPPEALHFKKLFGHDQLYVTHGECRYRFHPTSFSQVNQSMVPVMLEFAKEMLAPLPEESLLDLYCGYGLFSHYLAPYFRQVLAIDAEGHSIRSAIDNSALNSKRRGRTKFLAQRITSGTLAEVLESFPNPDSVILDPPRLGPQTGVIPTLCSSHPQNVLHIFCGIDQIPDSLKEWKLNGYEVRRVVPLDMFPGTMNLEVMILLIAGKKHG